MSRALALVATVVGLVLWSSTGGTAPGAQQRCPYSIVYEGTTYLYVPRENVVPGARVGRAVRPGCNDIGGRPPPGAKSIEAFRFGTASPRVALTTHEQGLPAMVVAVPGRCFGFGNGPDYVRCLQTDLRFRGRGYTALRGPELPQGGALGRGLVHGRPVRLLAIQGIDPRIALARGDRPQEILVAHRRCERPPVDPLFMRCLRAPLWLRIHGTTRVRTAAVESPGSLLRSTRMRLFLAPDGVADEMTSPDDDRLTPAGRLTVNRKGRGSTSLAIVDSVAEGSYAVVAELPGRRIVVVGGLYV